MTPYYDEGGITIYHGDCREILPALLPVDIILSDPPYGISYQSAWRTAQDRKPPIHGDNEYPTWIFDWEVRNAMFVCCRWECLSVMARPTSLIVWDKCAHGMGNLDHEFGRQWEAVAFYPGTQHNFLRRPVDLIRCPRVPASSLVHPNEKPVGLFLPLLRAHTGCVVDPFMGSGTTLIAARDMGRHAIGIEIEERYCEIAAKRLAQGVMEFE